MIKFNRKGGEFFFFFKIIHFQPFILSLPQNSEEGNSSVHAEDRECLRLPVPSPLSVGFALCSASGLFQVFPSPLPWKKHRGTALSRRAALRPCTPGHPPPTPAACETPRGGEPRPADGTARRLPGQLRGRDPCRRTGSHPRARRSPLCYPEQILVSPARPLGDSS